MPATNWALAANGASADASTTYSTYVASNAIDANDSTKFSSNSPMADQWLRVDLGQTRSVAALRVAQGSNACTAFKVQKSTDNTNWTDVFVRTTALLDETCAITATTAQYWRILVTAGSASQGWELSTFALWDAFPSAFPYAVGGSTYSSFVAANAVDGNDATYWSSNWPIAGKWLRVDWGVERVFSGHRLFQFPSTNNVLAYVIETSSNGDDWTTIYTRAATAPADETIAYASPVTARYIRIRATNDGGGDGWQVKTFAPVNAPVPPAKPPQAGGGGSHGGGGNPSKGKGKHGGKGALSSPPGWFRIGPDA